MPNNNFETPPEYETVLLTVESWSAATRLKLVHDVVETIYSASDPKAATGRGKPVEELIGIGRGDNPPPDDQAVEQWLNEWRSEKYG